MRDQDIIIRYNRQEEKIRQLIQDHWILSYHFSAMQRVLRDKGLVTAEEHNAQLAKMEKEIKEIEKASLTGGKNEELVKNDKPTGEGSKEAVPNTSDTAGQVLPNQELPKPEVGAVRPPSLIQRLWRATFGRKRGGAVS